jgi:hypothetical protein
VPFSFLKRTIRISNTIHTKIIVGIPQFSLRPNRNNCLLLKIVSGMAFAYAEESVPQPDVG